MKISGRPVLAGLLLAVLSLVACNPNVSTGSGEVLVRVYDRYLYTSDLEGVVPPGTSARDSLTMVRTFIQNWVDKELIVRKAEENLPEELQDFSRQIEEYRNSLIIFEYEKMLVRQELDTNISMPDVREYYEQHKRNFVLEEDILELRYLVLHEDSPAMNKFRQYIRSAEQAGKDSLALYASKYASVFSLLDDYWIKVEELSEVVPVETYSLQEFNMNRQFMEVKDSVFVYMIYINDFKPVDSISPVQFVVEDIRKVILNRRKNILVKNMRQSVLQDAIEHNQVEIY